MNEAELPFTLFDAYFGPQAGSYELEAEHSLKYTDAEKKTHGWTGKAELAFTVTAPRLVLPSADVVHACYPPLNAEGHFGESIPYVSFGRRSFPWERAMITPPSDANRATPWIALLVLTPDDLADAALRSVSGEALVTADEKDKAEFYSPWTADASLKLDDADKARRVSVLEMDARRFQGLCPRLDELQFLANVRRVSVARKEGNDAVKERDFALLLANRFPQEGLNTAVVVSLEAWQGWLEGWTKDDSGWKHKTSTQPRVRVVALHSWQFRSKKGDGTCAEQVLALRARALTFTDKRLGKFKGETAALKAVRGALKQGYSPVAYQPMDDARSFAWYRGPLAPVAVKPFGKDEDTFVKADAALVVDESVGMVDLSYTSAWQLGQLLALSSSSFGAAVRAVSQAMYREVLRDAELNGKDPPKEPKRKIADKLVDYFNTLKDHKALSKSPIAENLRVMTEWLAELALLYSVPLRYLVPSKKLLPHKSLRVFHLDSRWIDALTDGALSVGASSLTERAALRSKRGKMQRVIRQSTLNLRRAARKEPALAFNQEEFDKEPAPICGFLLRSQVLRDFPGVEIEIHDKAGDALPVLRRDDLTEGVHIFLAMGVPATILVREPREGLRFGTEKKKLSARDTLGGETGVKHDVPAREAAGVVDVKGLAAAMRQQAWLGPEASGALYALQWLRPPRDVKIPWTYTRAATPAIEAVSPGTAK